MTDAADAPPAPRLAAICRHPIKSIGHEDLAEVTLAAGQPMPLDRLWAVAHAASGIAGPVTDWRPKVDFLRGVAAPGLMAIRARTDPQARQMILNHPSRPELTLWPDRDGDGARLIDWLRPLWPDSRPAPATLVRAATGALTDGPDPHVAVLNLASLRALGQRLGQRLSIHRWRGNLWLDGLAPWEEFDLIGRRLQIGPVTLLVEERITRCRATMANPDTGTADADTLGALEAGYGHTDFGVFARVLAGGRLQLNDPVRLP